ncbi:leucine-rich repeat extensin-like protein 2 [Drosophila innubila]|uniref:leucine-rich repeat extensin-like protein 2 n=1 Tax=Drosophila innubila TaxID=198719 RepID=UPI00148D68E7|nr:leucine-rich repeat extensin-like protein 2 [Drosophila innubila]
MHLNMKPVGLLLLLATVVGVNAATLRQQRDVSHLPLEYLPPVVLPPLPSHEYLPPVEQHAASLSHVLQPPRDYLPPVEQPKLSNEYLPPATTTTTAATTTTEATTEQVTTDEAATTTELPTEAPQQQEQTEPETEAPLDLKTHEDIVQGAGDLLDDGYHYQTPETVPDLTLNVAPVEAYLPPLDDNAVVAEALPHSEESAALLDDGYHYRAIRRLRL